MQWQTKTPKRDRCRFFPIYVKLKERRDGGVDRTVVYQPLPHRLRARETRASNTKLNNPSVKEVK